MAGRLHGLSEEVGKVVGGADIRHLEFERLDHVTDKEMAPLHMLHAVVVFRVIGHVTRTLRVSPQRSGVRLGATHSDSV